MRFEFATSNRIIFGPGTIAELPSLARALGQRAFMVVDSAERADLILGKLRSIYIDCLIIYEVKSEPNVEFVNVATRNAREADCDLVIGMGGGSALDTGKTVAALLTNSSDILEYLEVIGQGNPLRQPSVPFIAIPTTAGTGSEVTRNAVIASSEHKIKASLRSPYMLPKVAIVDPELTYSLPPALSASTGLDALTQLIEPFVCNAPNPMTDAICREGIRRVGRSLQNAYKHGGDKMAREDMALASLFGGMALANAKLGAVHGLANPIGGMCHAPHGAICARLLPLVMNTNLQSLKAQDPNSPALARYAEIAKIGTGNADAAAVDGVLWVQGLCRVLDITPLANFGLKPMDFPTIVMQGQKASSMKGNPVPLSDYQLTEILEKSL